MKFLTNMERQLHWPQKGTAEVVALSEDAFLPATDDDAGQAALLGLTDTSAPTEARALQTAVRYVEEWKVVGASPKCYEGVSAKHGPLAPPR